MSARLSSKGAAVRHEGEPHLRITTRSRPGERDHIRRRHDMRYMLLIYTNQAAWAELDGPQTEQMMADYGTFTQRIIESGEFSAGDPLQGLDTATSVRVRDGKVDTTDGPFAETKEVLGGY